MVAHTGEAAGAGAIRALNEPRPINVRAGERGVPLEVQVDGWQRVLAVEERCGAWTTSGGGSGR